MGTTGLPARRRLEAGGSLPRGLALVEPGPARRRRLIAELAVLFIGAPLAMTLAVYGLHIPLFMVLPPVLGVFVLYLLWDDTFHVRGELNRGFGLTQLLAILGLFVVAAALVALFVALAMPTSFLSFPRQAPRLWLIVILAYPIASVMAQELVYRTFYFHRYGPLFGERRWLAIGLNGALFGFAHIIFGNVVSVALTMVIGVLLAWRYERTRSFWAVWLEHSLYGGLVFTVGLGRYFFTGVASLG